MKARAVEDLGMRVTKMETASGETEEEGTGEPEEAKTIGRSLYQRVQRLKARLLRPGGAVRNPGDHAERLL
jgi:hypothetical protein